MWDFRHGSAIISVTISDKEWLNKFQSRKVDVRPGDSIRGIVEITHRYDFDGELLSTHCSMTRVLEVVRVSGFEQLDLFSSQNEPPTHS